MNILNIDINQYIPDIIETYTEVFGEEYRKIIEKRINGTEFIMYNNYEGVCAYYKFLIMHKRKERNLKFLKQIEEISEKYLPENYELESDEQISKLVQQFNGSKYGVSWMPKEELHIRTGIFLWSDSPSFIDEKDDKFNKLYPEGIKKKKINFINFLKENNKEPLIEDNFDEFFKTDEYKEYETNIHKILSIYDKIQKEYSDYIQELKPYREYIDNEIERYRLSVQSSKELYDEIQEYLPEGIKNFLDQKYSSNDERITAFLEFTYILNEVPSQKLFVEYFSKEDEMKLKDDNTSIAEKENIYFCRNMYFSQMYMFEMGFPEDENGKEIYEKNIEKEDIKKIIVPSELADLISKKRKNIYEKNQIVSDEDKAHIAYYKDFFNNIKSSQRICHMAASGNTKDTIFFTIRDGEQGIEDYILLHEICHAIEENQENGKTGFDTTKQSNNYNNLKRKYERLNETITDIFAIEARQNNIEKGIYIIEPKELIKEKVQHYNTSNILKNMLAEFMEKYRKDIIKARITGNMNDLYKIIGESNFEELNDIINYTDFLIEKSQLEYRLNNNDTENKTVIEYNNQLKRLEQVYKNMENHNLEKNAGNSLLNSAIEATHETVRMGQISSTVSDIENKLKENNAKDKEK